MDAKDVCIEIENDEFYSKFLVESVKPLVGENISVTEQVNRLTQGIEKLTKSLESQVLAKHNDLLTQASNISDLEAMLESVRSQVQGLLRSADKLKDRVHTPYDVLESQTMMLDRVQTTCNLLRHSAKILTLWNKLISVKDNPTKEAMILFELNELINDYDFKGITLLDDILTQVEHQRKELLKSSTDLLQSSLLNGDKVKLLQCFKVFHNLQCTEEQIKITVDSILRDLRKEINTALNVQMVSIEVKKSSSGRIAPGKANIMNAQDFKIKLWDNIDKLFKNEMYNSCMKVVMLQNVVNELHAIGNFRNIAKKFWDELSLIFSNELEKSPSTVSQSIEIDFPKLLKCFNDLLSKLKCKNLEMNRSCLTKWENAFLSKSLAKLLEPVRSMWHLNQVPTMDQIDNAIRVIAEALSISLADKNLSISLAYSVAKSIKQMNVEAEQRLSMDSDVAQIIEAPTSSQQKNADLCNALYYFSSQIKRVLVNMNSMLPQESVQIVQNSLKGMSSLPVLNLFAESIKNSLYLILITMHDEPDLIRAENPNNKTMTCSPYMKELQQFVSRCKDIYLSLFNEKQALNECCIDISKCCIERFMHHVCNVRPLSLYGRAKLQADCKHLETSLAPLVNDITELGDHYRQLKALSMLLEKKPQDIAKSQHEGALLPYSLVMMYLFSYGGQQLLAPHVCAGWNIQKLIQWLDSHKDERDRLEFVAGALQRYQNHVRQNQITCYDEVYPVLLQLLEDGRKALKN
ncbi:conserved oligomeric Golgi complex subunit 5 [Maniola jurtina]|uniref:conserved oligomeric Golgi complex subunit 5 n=1 Tax=Maniola jurtina TaxID=191418 RepID=UPI001E68EF00|nr:conserved oligomeric Golgi complex subunit 5 [Maniola jurtina]XP_045775490.1 conserved oligomeric Golgi complex subunit 5 [Maniola jurtina]